MRADQQELWAKCPYRGPRYVQLYVKDRVLPFYVFSVSELPRFFSFSYGARTGFRSRPLLNNPEWGEGLTQNLVGNKEALWRF